MRLEANGGGWDGPGAASRAPRLAMQLVQGRLFIGEGNPRFQVAPSPDSVAVLNAIFRKDTEGVDTLHTSMLSSNPDTKVLVSPTKSAEAISVSKSRREQTFAVRGNSNSGAVQTKVTRIFSAAEQEKRVG